MNFWVATPEINSVVRTFAIKTQLIIRCQRVALKIVSQAIINESNYLANEIKQLVNTLQTTLINIQRRPPNCHMTQLVLYCFGVELPISSTIRLTTARLQVITLWMTNCQKLRNRRWTTFANSQFVNRAIGFNLMTQLCGNFRDFHNEHVNGNWHALLWRECDARASSCII